MNSITRRTILQSTCCGFGSLALRAILQDSQAHARASGDEPSGRPGGPLAPKPTHHLAKAKRVLFLFMSGGPSQMDLFDPKPELLKRTGQALPYKLPDTEATVGLDQTKLLGPIAGFEPHGQSGLMVSELLPLTGKHADDLCVLRAVQADSPNHPLAIRQMHTGNLFDVVPSMGSWLSYGLGTENQQLPSYITLLPQEGDRNYSSAFLPAIHQGTAIQDIGSGAKSPIRHLSDLHSSPEIQRRRIDWIQAMNRRQLARLQSDQQMEGVIESFELAFRMQTETPKLVDLSGESQETLDLYGIGQPGTDEFGRQCLLARRCRVSDKPIAGLLTDLKRRGLLSETLVLWGGEFGRTPHAQNGDGREHNHHGFTMWMAGGGVRGGMTHGTTDDFGYYGLDGRVHINDLHATILHLMGLDHERLTYDHHGRPFRLTDVAGKIVEPILA
ncbi:MAG: DUF1501 domain-containing protein [Pirellula sp.]|nr:DUF1501 domain-containing protein [Pirellula sp.]